MTNTKYLLIAVLGIALSASSCKKEYNTYFSRDMSETFAGRENYDVSEAYIKSHNFLIVDADNAHQNGTNGPLSWKIQGIDKDGNLENMFVRIDSVNEGVWWQAKYQPGNIISGTFALSVRKK